MIKGNLVKDEKGQALPLALAALALGVLLVPVFMQSVSSHSIASRIYTTSILEHSSSDAGVEDAIWRLIHDTLASSLTSPGDTVSYSMGESVNSNTPNIDVTRTVVANDDFENGGWDGGSGWLNGWYQLGYVDVTKSQRPHGGEYHLEINGGQTGGNYAYVKRAADLYGQSALHIQLWIKVKGLEAGDELYCQVSPDNTNWITVKMWTDSDDDNTYHSYDIDLSAQAPYSSEFWIAFSSNMNQKNDVIFIDDINIVEQSTAYYEIVSTTGNERIRADIAVQDASVSIEAWQTERFS